MLVKLFIFLVLLSTNLCAGSSRLWGEKDTIDVKGNSMTLYKQGEKMVLKGDAVVKRFDMNISSDRMEIWQKAQKFKGYGNVLTEKLFEGGDFVKSISKKIFYTDKKKIMELFEIDNLDYFLKKENKTLNVLADYLKVEEKGDIRSADFKKVVSMTFPFEEEKDDGTIVRGTSTIKADKIKAMENIKDDKDKYAELIGNVLVVRQYDNGEYFMINAEKCVYFEKDNIVEFNEVKELEVFSLEENTTYILTCDDLSWDLKEGKGKATGKPIKFKKYGEDYTVTSNVAFFDRGKQEVLFTENPVATQSDEQGDGVYKAEKILYYLETKLVKMLGNVQIDFLPRKKEDKIE